MKKSEFIDALQETLEVDDCVLTGDTVLENLAQYNSLSVLKIIVLIDENFDKRLKSADFKTITSIDSLIEQIGVENFKG